MSISTERSEGSPKSTRRAWWTHALPVLGRAPEGVTNAQYSLLGVVALALVFEHYDISTLNNAAPYIRDSFGIPQSDLGRLLAWVRLGALPALVLMPLADRIGRRRLFLGCLLGTAVGSAISMLAPSIEIFIVGQVFVRTCLVAGSATAFVIVAEELPSEHRGWAIGYLGALALVGVGLAALIFSAVKQLPFGWRALYAPGVVPLLMIGFFAKRIPETARFEQARAQLKGRSVGFMEPLVQLLREHPLRALLLGAITFLVEAGQGSAHGLAPDFIQTDRGWSPGQLSTLIIAGGGIGIAGTTLSGRLADRIGRRRVGAMLFALFPVGAFIVYSAGSGLMIPGFVLLVFVTTGANTILRAFSTELFPTSARGTASGLFTLVGSVGAASGLYLVTQLTSAGESVAFGVRVVAVLALIAAVLAWLLPETARRELDDIP